MCGAAESRRGAGGWCGLSWHCISPCAHGTPLQPLLTPVTALCVCVWVCVCAHGLCVVFTKVHDKRVWRSEENGQESGSQLLPQRPQPQGSNSSCQTSSFFFLNRVSCVRDLEFAVLAVNGLKLLVFLPPPPTCWDYRCMLSGSKETLIPQTPKGNPGLSEDFWWLDKSRHYSGTCEAGSSLPKGVIFFPYHCQR